MFLRVTKAKNNHYVCIVQAYRDAYNKPKQKVIQNLGSFITLEQKNSLYPLGTNLIKSMAGLSLFSAQDIIEVARENYGAANVIDQLFKVYRLDYKIAELLFKRKIDYDFIGAVKYMAAARFISPSSKRKSFLNQDRFCGFGDFDLPHL